LIPYGRQDITQRDIDAVVETLQSSFLTQGPKVPEFEKNICSYVGSQHAVAFNSATSALHASCISLGLSKNDIFWTSPISFVASANCGLYCGANVDFVDIDPVTNNMCPNALERKLIKAKDLGKLPKVVIVVHLSGMPCDMKSIHALSIEYNFRIIEDASHAIGSELNQQKTGSCIYSDIAIFSFHPVKIITTAEGGMAVTNNHKIYEDLSILRTHGITRDINQMSKVPDGPWYYEQKILGFNYRMTDLQAALGITQLSRIDDLLKKRRMIKKQYDNELSNLPVLLPHDSNYATSALHLYIIRLKLDEINSTHLEVFMELRSKGIGVNLHYIPIYRQPYFKRFNFDLNDFVNSEQYYKEAISIPIFPSMDEVQQDEVINSITSIIGS
jgi:UDP-4-amino-4,6-dideoxy-N-acetyl-beta-L-altrosamine transaminase